MQEKFIEFMKNNGLAENTYNSYASDIKLYKKYYIDSYGEKLDRLTHSDVSMYKSFLLNKGASPKTINRKLSALKMYNQFLIQENIQDEYVIKEKDFIKIQGTMIQKKLLSNKQINQLKHYASKDKKNAKRDYCFIILLTYGGFRESELVNIKITDINLEDRFINIIGKGQKFRQVVINDIMYDAIIDYLEERTKIDTKNPYLFVGQKNRDTLKPVNRNFCNRLLDKYKKLCKLKNLYPHLLRAQFCSNALHNAGYSIEQVASQAGHSSLNTTKIYLVSEHQDILSLSNKL